MLAWPALLCAEALSVKNYLALGKRHSAVRIRTTDDQTAELAGKIIEVRGRLSGISKSGDSGCMIIATAEGGSFVIETARVPSEPSGTLLACLVKVPEQTGQGGLRLVAWTYDADLQRHEQSVATSAKSKPAPSEAPKPASKQAVTTSPAKSTASAKASKELTGEELVAIYANAIKGFNKRLSNSEADTIARSILGFSYRYKLDARLVCAVILAESHFRIEATSRCGAQGLGQLMPSTAAGLGVNNAYDPVENVYGSVRYIKSMLDRMSGNKHWNDLTWKDLALALAAYNAGPGAVKKHGGIPPYRETRNYVKKVTEIYKKLCGVSS
jgi:soluble lytic murein transglycosylase-like protein